jgi:RNA polymerase sigma-70 factor, ECF subfamily
MEQDPAGHTPSVETSAAERTTMPVIPPAFDDVYRDNFTFVWRGVRALRVADHAVEDVVQEVFVAAHRHLHEFEGRSAVRTWVAGILLNVVRHHRRTVVRRSPHELTRDAPTDADTLPTDTKGPHEAAVTREETRLLEQILGDLEEKKREILMLAELQELSAPEIAEVLGVGVNTVYSRLRVAREDFERLAARARARNRWRMP